MNKADEIYAIMPKAYSRWYFSKKLLLTGSTLIPHPSLNFGSGLDVTDSSQTINDDYGGSHHVRTRNKIQSFTIPNQSFTGSVHSVVQFTSGSEVYSGDFTLQNYIDYDINKIVFPEKNKTYIFKLYGIVPKGAQSQNPLLHVDFAESGSVSTEIAGGGAAHHLQGPNRFTVEMRLQTNQAAADHQHFAGSWPVYVDDDLYASGAQLYASTTGDAMELKSGSLMVCEL